ncbi:MAG TPA: metalloregulator ArsR/SmtB family transcription factor [Gemmataceae bacterium]
MPRDPLQPRRCAELLSALAAPERLKIVRLLADGERNVTQITESLSIPPLNVSHHLTVLKTAGLIRGRKQGRFVWYALRPGVLEEAVEAGVPKEALNLGCCRIEFPPAAGARPNRRRAGCEPGPDAPEPTPPGD